MSEAQVPPKDALKQELVLVVRRDLETLERAHQTTQRGATHEEAKPENDKDTRALEQSYLARGQALRVLELRRALLELEAMPVNPLKAEAPIVLGALVAVEDEQREQSLFLAPHGGGTLLAQDSVRVVTPQSPLGRALLGKRVGDACALKIAERLRELLILRVS